MKQYKYHYFYRIENLIDGKFYYGIHSTNNIDDKYMGSGKRLKDAMNLFGKENFIKEILKYFDSREKASEYEALMVTEELVHDKECYNVKCGGDYGLTSGSVLVKDKDGNFMRVPLEDERYKRGELVNFMVGVVPVFDKKEEKYKLIDKKEFNDNRNRYITKSDGKITVKNENGEYIKVSIDDDRYKNGDLTPIWAGRHHSEETKIKISNAHQKNGYQKGEKNSQYGTCWVTKNCLNKKIDKKDLEHFLNDGWKKGRYVNKENIKYQTDSIDIDYVLSLYEKYKNWTKISSVLGINRSTLLNFRKRHNLH